MKKVQPGEIISQFIGYSSINELLLMAAQTGNVQLARIALEYGADVNAKPERGFDETALMTAARQGDDKMARMLVEKGADINIKTLYGFTAADLVPRQFLPTMSFISSQRRTTLTMLASPEKTTETTEFPFD